MHVTAHLGNETTVNNIAVDQLQRVSSRIQIATAGAYQLSRQSATHKRSRQNVQQRRLARSRSAQNARQAPWPYDTAHAIENALVLILGGVGRSTRYSFGGGDGQLDIVAELSKHELHAVVALLRLGMLAHR